MGGRRPREVPPNVQFLTLIIVFFIFAVQTEVILANIWTLPILFVLTALSSLIAFFSSQSVSKMMGSEYGKCALLSCITAARNSPGIGDHCRPVTLPAAYTGGHHHAQ